MNQIEVTNQTELDRALERSTSDDMIVLKGDGIFRLVCQGCRFDWTSPVLEAS